MKGVPWFDRIFLEIPTRQKNRSSRVIAFIQDYEDVFLAPGRIRKRPYQVHAHQLQWDVGEHKQNQGGWWHYSHNPGPVEPVIALFKGVFHLQMVPKWVGMCQVHHGVHLGAGNYQEGS